MVGKVTPEIVNPTPETAPVLIVTEAVPVDVSVTDWVEGVFKSTFPKAMLLALTPSDAAPTFSCRAKVVEIPPKFAVRVTARADETAEYAALKLAVVAPAAIVTLAGTVTAVLLLLKLTLAPPLGAALVKDTVHTSVPVPATAALLHETEPRLAELDI